MNIAYSILDEPVFIDKGTYLNITIENKEEFLSLFNSFGDEAKLKIYENLNEKKDYLLIQDVLNITFNSKTIINKITKDLASLSEKDENINKLLDIKQRINNYMEKLIFNYDYPVKINNELTIENIIKVLDIYLDDNYDNYLSKFIEYLDINNKILNKNIFITFNLSLYFNKQELKEIKKYIELHELYLINCDIIYIGNKDIIKTILFDNDLCRVI